MPENIDKNSILKALADRLPDELLTDLFPDYSPRDIRELLRNSINFPGRKEEKKHSGKKPEQKTLSFSGAKEMTCSLYTDGASRGNPGEAGAGIVLFDNRGRELTARSQYLGRCTNNAAEYLALIKGLETALETGCLHLHIFLDSELIVRQVQGIYKVKNEQLKPLFARVQNLLQKMKSWQIRHVPREKNSRADELANRGIDDNNQN